MLIIKDQMYDLKEFKPWCGAEYNYRRIVEKGVSEEFIDFIGEMFPQGLSETELNDILWFEDDLIDEFLGETEEPFN